MLDLGCGHGYPLSAQLFDAGCTVRGVDASPFLLARFRERFPEAPAPECADVCAAESLKQKGFFDGVLAWGLLFLLGANVQRQLIAKVAYALKPGGEFLFTSPALALVWEDVLTGAPSLSPM